MSLRDVISVSIMGIFFAAGASASSAIQFQNGIEAALGTGDYFGAYRTSLAFEDALPVDFQKLGIANYFKSLFIVGSHSEIKTQCDFYAGKSSIANYACGLHFVEKKDVDQGLSYLEAIDKKSGFYWPSQIIISSALLIKNNPELALLRLRTEELGKYKARQLDQLFYLTRSRTLLALGRYDESIEFSQSIDSYSPYYVEALEQTAWAFFKIRKFESAQILLDVLISSFESPKKTSSDLNISSTLYYRSRYLKAYLALLEQRPEGASNEFSQLKGDYDKFLKQGFSEFNLTALTSNFSSSNGLADMKSLPPLVENQTNYMADWLGAEISLDFQSDARFQVAVNKEINRMKKLNSKESTGYLAGLLNLKMKSYKNFEMRDSKSIIKLQRAMETLSLKAELGRLDVFWLNRAQGARTLDEVIESYKQSTRSVESYTDL